jgi:hypothetical protein
MTMLVPDYIQDWLPKLIGEYTADSEPKKLTLADFDDAFILIQVYIHTILSLTIRSKRSRDFTFYDRY